MRRAMLLMASTALACALAGAASADVCEAIPQDGPLPSYLSFGSTFSGRVVEVIDGDSLCVAVGPTPKDWVEVRLADFYAPERNDRGASAATDVLRRTALGKTATCVANLRSYDRIAARCAISGRPLGDLMRQAGASEGGRGFDPAPASSSSAQGRLGRAMFRSCAAARAAGAAPMRRGEPTYNPNLDGDADGIACEPYRPR